MLIDPSDLILEFWRSEKTSAEEKAWLDKMSIRRQFKFSEQVKIMKMYEDKIGPLTGKIFW